MGIYAGYTDEVGVVLMMVFGDYCVEASHINVGMCFYIILCSAVMAMVDMVRAVAVWNQLW